MTYSKQIQIAANAEDIKEMQQPFRRKDLLSTGSTLLNLACSSNPYGGILKGRFVLLVGDSASGKTFFCLSLLTEALRSKSFEGYRLIYDNVEGGCEIDISRLFGDDISLSIEPPEKKCGESLYSGTVEEFYFHVDDAFIKGKPFVYILDSMDGLSSESESMLFEKAKKALRTGKEIPGSYGDGKAKQNSQFLRRTLPKLRDTNSILVIVSQTRDNLGFGFEKRVRSGGRALRFYATTEIWTSLKSKITKRVRGKLRTIGVEVQAQVRKNRLTGLLDTITVPIYPCYGIDDISSCVDYLVDEGEWKKVKGKIATTKFKDNICLSREDLIKHIEENKLESSLCKLVWQTWKGIREECNLQRKAKY